MKSLFQIILLCLLIVVGLYSYNNYFFKEKIEEVVDPKVIQEEPLAKAKNNIIKNLKYNVELSDSGKYEIKSDLSEVIIKDGSEIVTMKNVTAIFTDKNNKKLYINSDHAEFNSTNYNTFFRDNIKIKYEKNNITSDNLDFDFTNNNILVYENVVYIGTEGKVQTDNIRIDLITKNTEIFMNHKGKNIKAVSF